MTGPSTPPPIKPFCSNAIVGHYTAQASYPPTIEAVCSQDVFIMPFFQGTQGSIHDCPFPVFSLKHPCELGYAKITWLG